MEFEDWEIVEIREDLSGREERWLVIYNVPEKYARDGMFSHSFPKSTFSYRAAEFGFDPDDPDDREQLFQLVLHGAYLWKTGRLSADGDLNPINDRQHVVRSAAGRHLSEVKQVVRLKQSASPSLRVSGISKESVPSDILDVIRNDMRIDRELMAAWGKKVEGLREERAREKVRRSARE